MRRRKADVAGDRDNGFATLTVLGLLAVIGLLSAAALHDALFGEQLATSRLLQQRAAALADLGIEEGMARLGALAAPEPLSFALQPMPPSNDTVRVVLQPIIGAPAAPRGNSLGRIVTHHFEIQSTGYVPRGLQVTMVQGASRDFVQDDPAGEALP